MKPPFVLDDRGDLSFYATAETLAINVEPVDVRHGLYRVFDLEGRELRICIEKVSRSWLGRTLLGTYERCRLVEDPHENANPSDLRQRIIHFLNGDDDLALQADLELLPMANLVLMAICNAGINADVTRRKRG